MLTTNFPNKILCASLVFPLQVSRPAHYKQLLPNGLLYGTTPFLRSSHLASSSTFYFPQANKSTLHIHTPFLPTFSSMLNSHQ